MMTRCNNCMREFDCDDDLELVELPNKDICNGCPNCRTDAYLMDIGDGDDNDE